MVFRRLAPIFIISTIILSSLCPIGPVSAQSGNKSIYYPETGHTVRMPFYDFFTNMNGISRFGYPITDDFVDPQTRLLVQYFQKARLEWHPENADPYKVLLGLLSENLGKREAPIPVSKIPSKNDPNCRYFDETQHSACWSFLKYWQTNGGTDLFGPPITENKRENGLVVQYFQRAKMEWHPEKPEGQRVQLAPLGEIYFDYAVSQGQLAASLLDPNSPNGQDTVITIHGRGSVLGGSVSRGGKQVAFVYVYNQLRRPVKGAAVILIVHYAEGDQVFYPPPTNEKGIASYDFSVGNAKAGSIIPLEFIVSYPGVKDIHVPTSYMVWYR